MGDRRWLRIGLWVVAVGLTLRPTRVADELVGLLAAPLQIAAEIAYPLRLGVRGRVVEAAESLEARQDADNVEQESLRAALDGATRPTEPALVEDRRFVFAEVVGRLASGPDELRAWVPDASGVEAGQPVVCGDAYVGRVATVVPREDGEAWIDVELVTASGFQVGARVEEGPDGLPVYMTVGGVRAAERDALDLAVHNPSNRDLDGGVARVHELIADADPYSDLAEGYRLGAIVAREGSSEWSVRPELDYLDGLFQVMVVTPPSAGPEVRPYDPSTERSAWLAARPLTMGDANPRRASIKLRSGALAGVRPGAAVTSRGAHLVGRVERVGPFVADVRLLDDPGLHVVAVALLEGDPEPRPLGRLTSLGRDGDAVRFRWTPRVAVPGTGGSVTARLFTGSGDAGMATAFPIGSTELPLGVAVGDEAVLRVVPDVDGRHASPLFVYAGTRRDAE